MRYYIKYFVPFFCFCGILQAASVSRVDNTDRKFFTPVSRQKYNCCSQKSAVEYMFAYEINVLRNADGSRPENCYPAHFTWKFLNNGKNEGTEVAEGWEVGQFMGLMNSVDYGKWPTDDVNSWVDGYEKYYHAMKNRVDKFEFVEMTEVAHLDEVRSWLYNHCDPKNPVGGLWAYDQRMEGFAVAQIPAGEYESGKSIITKWGQTGGGHLMTICGYDDNVGYDFNGDGKITNDVDITGDGKVDLADWERGAFILVNSWGHNWANKGRVYVPYRHSATTDWDRGKWLARIWVKNHEPEMTLKIRFSADNRQAVKLRVGVSTILDAGEPQVIYEPELFSRQAISQGEKEVRSPARFSCFYRGDRKTGKVSLAGGDKDKPIEMGFDLSRLVPAFKAAGDAVYFLELSSHEGMECSGKVLAASVMFYEKGKLLREVKFDTSDGAFGKGKGLFLKVRDAKRPRPNADKKQPEAPVSPKEVKDSRQADKPADSDAGSADKKAEKPADKKE